MFVVDQNTAALTGVRSSCEQLNGLVGDRQKERHVEGDRAIVSGCGITLLLVMANDALGGNRQTWGAPLVAGTSEPKVCRRFLAGRCC